MVRKRPTALEALVDIAPPADKKKETKKAEDLRYGKPTTYRIPIELCEQIRRIAKNEQVGISDLATFALRRFVSDYKAENVTLPKTDPIKYGLDLD